MRFGARASTVDSTAPGMSQAVMWRLIKEVSHTHVCNTDHVHGDGVDVRHGRQRVMLNRVEICHTDEVYGSTCSVDLRKGQGRDFAIRTMDNNAAVVLAPHIEQIQEGLSYRFDGTLAGIRSAPLLFRISRLLSAVILFLKCGSLGMRSSVPRPPANDVFSA